MTQWGEQLGLFAGDGFPKLSASRINLIEEQVVDIAKSTGLEITAIKWKDNRRVMASVGKGGVLNLHRIYQRATEPDIKILAKVMTGKASKRESGKFYEYIDNNLPKELGNGKSRLVVMPPQGLFHDLKKSLERLLPLADGPLDPMPNLGWTAARVGRRGITWGTHRETSDGPLILVNAILDAPDVPNFVLEHIIWHELCHQLAPPEKDSNGRRAIHSRAFKKMESRYPRLEQAEKWEQEQVARFIRRHL